MVDEGNNFIDEIFLAKIGMTTSFALQDKTMVLFSQSRLDYCSFEEVSMEQLGFQGFVYVNRYFFKGMFPEKHSASSSQFINIAKGFFSYEGKNHACLVQYCGAGKHSSEHYHRLDEYIGCIAGSVDIKLCPVDGGLERHVLLSAGGVIHIPPKTLHFLSSGEGSITVPVKQTIKGKKDHYFLEGMKKD